MLTSTRQNIFYFMLGFLKQESVVCLVSKGEKKEKEEEVDEEVGEQVFD